MTVTVPCHNIKFGVSQRSTNLQVMRVGHCCCQDPANSVGRKLALFPRSAQKSSAHSPPPPQTPPPEPDGTGYSVSGPAESYTSSPPIQNVQLARVLENGWSLFTSRMSAWRESVLLGCVNPQSVSRHAASQRSAVNEDIFI